MTGSSSDIGTASHRGKRVHEGSHDVNVKSGPEKWGNTTLLNGVGGKGSRAGSAVQKVKFKHEIMAELVVGALALDWCHCRKESWRA